MKKKYNEYDKLNLPEINESVLRFWKDQNIFKKSIDTRPADKPFVFYEGPPSANGMPGIHHVMARAVKDIFCRYKTLKGFRVERKAGWDTHGLPVELEVEKTLGIRKEDIGVKISIEDYNEACRKAIMKYTGVWNDLTERMGYWVDMENPYVTYRTEYMESVWQLLKKFYDKGLLYKGYTIQPYSPAAGTGLSTHELNQPGCYRNVKDRTAVAMFYLTDASAQQLKALVNSAFTTDIPVAFLAWTTTPWTLPSNTALAVGSKISYALVRTFNPFTQEPLTVILAEALISKYFSEDSKVSSINELTPGEKKQPWFLIDTIGGSALAASNLSYHQLLNFAQPETGDAFRVIPGDFVTTEDGTGIVHIAPSFGADDFRVAALNGIGSLTLVDKRGRFLPEVKDDVFLYGNEFVKEAYLNDAEKAEEFARQKSILESKGKIKELKVYLSVDERIVLKLQEEGKLFKKETYEHNYPHCWRTDKPVLYYPLDSWFVKTTAYKERMIELNKIINWKPESTGTGRFGNWLENLVDWNLSRSRYWGVPLPVWSTEDGTERKCIGSVSELLTEINEAVSAGVLQENPYGTLTTEQLNEIDLHRPFADRIILKATDGRPMYREPDLIDVWFDSGAMPYAQNHWMDGQPSSFPADFIAEGVDQTRGWFFTLHAIASGLFDSVAFKNVVSNGLVLDKNGNKMSKRLGNAVDPFKMGDLYGFDAVRWYMISNAAPWDNLKFDEEGIVEVQRKFFGTLYNTYSFFALYANVDGFTYSEPEIPLNERPESDRWILSLLHTLILKVEKDLENFEPHTACRSIQDFVCDDLSNWYVRLGRRRFWKGDYEADKISAYQTLYTCLETIARLMSPVAPFYSEILYRDLNSIREKSTAESVHLSVFPQSNQGYIDKELEQKMQYAQRISSMILSLRKKEKIRVRQPLRKALIPVLDEAMRAMIEDVATLIKTEVNIKELTFVSEAEASITKKIKPDFKKLGPKFGKDMKEAAMLISSLTQDEIKTLETNGRFLLPLSTGTQELGLEDVEILTEDIPGQTVASEGGLTVALDITLDEELTAEGLARDLVNRVQNIRKESGLEVTDRIDVKIDTDELTGNALKNNLPYICSEILADHIEFVKDFADAKTHHIELGEDKSAVISVSRI
jgi:isoleucyl-tRNA synthetase